jgi:hypothetical protein
MKKIILLLSILFLSCTENKQTEIEVTSVKEKKEGKKVFEYYNDDVLEKKLEYINLCNKLYLNQGWYYNKKKELDFERSNFFQATIGKTKLKVNDTTLVKFYYKPTIKNSIRVLLLCQKKIDNYCEITTCKHFDTLYFKNNRLDYVQSFAKPGKRNIGGYILEISRTMEKKKGKDFFKERRVYFKLPFEIVE